MKKVKEIIKMLLPWLIGVAVIIVVSCLWWGLLFSALAVGEEARVDSISPHAEGVCAPNDLPILEDEVEDTELVEVPEEEPADGPEEEEDVTWDENLTVEEMVEVNRDPDSEVWYHIEDEDCPSHAWEYCDDGEEAYRFCLNCGCTETLEREVPEEVPEDEPAIDDAEEEPDAEPEVEVE